MKLLDQDQDWFYIWLSMPAGRENDPLRLLKVSADRDCDPRDGGVRFADWRLTAGYWVPHRREFVSGLQENVDLTLEAESVEILSTIDPAMFEIPDELPSKH
jgi:hypothetical protein